MHLLSPNDKKNVRWLLLAASILVTSLFLYGCAGTEGQKGLSGARASWLKQAAITEARKKAKLRVQARKELRARVRQEVRQQTEAVKEEAAPAHKPAAPELKAQAAPQPEKPWLTELNVSEFPGGVKLDIGASSTLQYTSYTQESPPKLTINFIGAGAGALSQPLEIQKGPVNRVIANYLKDKDITRLEVELSETVPYEIGREGNRIIVSLFTRVVEEPQPLDKPPAIKVTNLRYDLLKGQTRIEADFKGKNPQYKVVRLKEPLRLMLEIKDALVEKELELEPEKPAGALKRVSISQSEKKGRPTGRIVALLAESTPYIVYQEGNTIKVDIDNPPFAAATTQAPPEAKAMATAKKSAAEGGIRAVIAEEAKQKAPAPEQSKKYDGNKISLDFQDAELSDILRLLAEVSGLNIITGPGVSGKVNIKMGDVPWDQALDLILRTQGYDFLKEGTVLWVDKKGIIEREKLARKEKEKKLAEEETLKAKQTAAPAKGKAAPGAPSAEAAQEYVTRVFAVNYVATERSGSGGLTTSAGSGESSSTGISTITTEDAPDIWGTITEGLNMILFGVASTETTRSDGQKMLIVNKFAGVIQITAAPDEMARAAEFLDTVEKSFLRQVMIQASIVEVNLSDDFQMGIDWTLVGEIAGDLSGALGGRTLGAQKLIGTGVPSTTPTGLFRLGITDNDSVTLLLDAISSQGEIHTLSNPKISTLNNQKAVIKVGREEVFFNTETTVTQGVSTISATAQNITVGLVLDVTPQVNPDGKITMWIHPSITELLEIVQGPGGATAPRLTTRETDTVVTMKNGQTLVLAGLIQDRKEKRRTGVPFLSKIPLLGALFRSSFEAKSKSELVIFINPTIVDENKITEISADEMKKLKNSPRRFYQ